jgi:hypothetical protein
VQSDYISVARQLFDIGAFYLRFAMRLKCNQCGHKWNTRKEEFPTKCASPWCRSKLWNDSKINNKKANVNKKRKSYTPEYVCWNGMKSRCNNQNNREYKRYGARGITYCKRWEFFENFLEDMGEKPSLDHSIERIDFNGNYEPSNTKWGTQIEQANNKRNNRYITHMGLTKTLSEWGRLSPVTGKTLGKRLKRGWGMTQALAFPSCPTGKSYEDYIANINNHKGIEKKMRSKKENKIVCIILARKGSKRCKNKNTKPFAGKSLTIIAAEQALRLRYLFSEIIFSSNDKIAINQVKLYGKGIKIRERPNHLCTSSASSEDAIDDAISWDGSKYEAILLLETTSPLRSDSDIITSIDIFKTYGQGVKSVTSIKNCIDGPVISDILQLNGCIHLWVAGGLRDTPYDRFSLHHMPPERSIHVDYPWEFDVAEMLYRRQT